MRRLPFGSAFVLVFAILIAFAVRVVPAYDAVITSSGINFQDNDSWYHMRVVHNIAAHFPWQSGFDPYAVFPGRQNAYTDPWDVFIAAVAWGLGLGKPSNSLIDTVGAWLPAVLGAILVIPLFLLAKRLYGDSTARWTAFAFATLPGSILWETHLGVPDHHVAECLLSLTALLVLCRAVESQGSSKFRQSALAGLLFGIYLCVRPAGIFVPATLAITVLIEPVLAPLMVACLMVASLVFLASSGSLWAEYTWLTLAGAIAVCLLAWGLDAFWRKRAWPKRMQIPALGIVALIALGILAAAKPVVFRELALTIRKYLPGSQNITRTYVVAELMPLWQIPPGGLLTVIGLLGGIWIPALPMLGLAIPSLWRSRPALVLASVWGLVMIIAGIFQMRMWIYGQPALAVAAGAGCAWLTARIPRLQVPISIALAAGLLGLSVPHVLAQSRSDGGPSSDWRLALTWLRSNTPEPMGNSEAWLRLWPALRKDQPFPYPPTAYGVLTWWDYGDWVNAIAHRIPSTNGTQTNSDRVAEFLTATSQETAEHVRTELSARYAVLNAAVTTDLVDTIARVANQDPSRFHKLVYEEHEGGMLLPVTLYLPDYYRTMAVRMYNFEGRPIVTSSEISVFTIKRTRARSGLDLDSLVSERKFASEAEALRFMEFNRGESAFIGSRDPMVSCINVEPLTRIKQVFTSSEPSGRSTVKVFELNP